MGPRAPPQMHLRLPRESCRLELRELALQDFAALRVFVAQIDPDLRRLARPGADQHAFEEAMRIGLQIDPVLDCAGLPLVAVDRHPARAGLVAHGAPLATGWTDGTPETPRPRRLQRR